MPTDSLNITVRDTAAHDQAAVRPLPRIDTLSVDSIAADSLAVDSVALDSVAADTVAAVVPPAWLDGLEPGMRQVQPGNHSGFLTIIAMMFVVLIFNFRHLKRLIRTYTEELWKVRSGRDNVFDERPAGDTRVLLMLMLQSIVCIGILLSTAICRVGPPGDMPLTGTCVAVVTGAVAAGYLFHFIGYNLVGYAFASPGAHHDWVRGYNASIALLGLALIIPAMLAIFYPQLSENVVLAAFLLYLCTKILFILKGFRIFFNKITSLVYFILYLCTLEIIPLLFVYKSSVLLAEHTL